MADADLLASISDGRSKDAWSKEFMQNIHSLSTMNTLSFIEMIIYLDAALIYGSKTAIEHAIKRAFQIQ